MRFPRFPTAGPRWFGRILLLCLLPVWALAGADRLAKPNVLFIMADDMRADVGSFGYATREAPGIALTPNLDRIARKGLLFDRAYCQIPSCSPSRSSMLTGLRPDSVKVYANRRHFRETRPTVVTLPQYFKQHGYHTAALGKIYHGGMYGASEYLLDPPSWSEPEWVPMGVHYTTQPSIDDLRLRYPEEFGSKTVQEMLSGRYKGPVWEAAPVDDAVLPDGQVARRAVDVLARLKDTKEPFFLAVGFVKPHAPFVAPKKYFDRVADARIVLPVVRDLPEGSTPLAKSFREVQGYSGTPQEGLFPDETTRQLIKAYDACVAYVDAQVGLLLQQLDDLGLSGNTIVVFTSDHGYHLGEAGTWGKNTNFEESVRVPLIISIPESMASGKRTDGIVELVDLYPTLAQLCGLPEPQGLEGTSFAPLIATPGREWKRAAFSEHSAVKHEPAGAVRGRTIGTRFHRYTEWREPENGSVVAEELYRIERGHTPAQSIAGRPEAAETLREMRQIMREGWQAARPR